MTGRAWLVLLAMSAVACGDDAGGSNESGGGSQAETQRAVAVALTSGIDIEGGLIRRGEIPEADADMVTLSQDQAPLDLTPGDPPVLMQLSFDNPDEGEDAVESTLIQFEEGDDHVEVPRMSSETGSDLSLEMTLDDTICDAFCNDVFTVTMIQAVKLASGKVSRHLERLLRLDCSQHGDPDLCEDSSTDEPDAGVGPTEMPGTGGMTGGGTNTIDRVLGSALVGFNMTHCTCMPDPMAADPVFCMAAPVTAMERDCLVSLVMDNADAVRASVSCLASTLMQCTTACDPTACDPTILNTFETTCGMLPAGVSTDFQACLRPSAN
jgi:hypothetical protein